MIPKVIHYCWFGNKPMPRLEKKCVDSWKRFCPDYRFIEWNETNFNINKNRFCSSAYRAGAWSFVSDYVRLKVVFDYGGIYLDTDVELKKPLDSLLDCDCYIGVQQIHNKCNTGLGFGAIQHSKAVAEMLSEYDTIEYSKEQAAELACPSLNESAVERMGYSKGAATGDTVIRLPEISIYPSKYFDPISMGMGHISLLGEDTYSVHHGSFSWANNRIRWKRKLVNLIGVEQVNKILRIVHH